MAKAVVAAPAEEYDPNPQYSYGYDIQDALTGDSKSQSETRNGDVVQGSYSVVDPDGKNLRFFLFFFTAQKVFINYSSDSSFLFCEVYLVILYVRIS